MSNIDRLGNDYTRLRDEDRKPSSLNFLHSSSEYCHRAECCRFRTLVCPRRVRSWTRNDARKLQRYLTWCGGWCFLVLLDKGCRISNSLTTSQPTNEPHHTTPDRPIHPAHVNLWYSTTHVSSFQAASYAKKSPSQRLDQVVWHTAHALKQS